MVETGFTKQLNNLEYKNLKRRLRLVKNAQDTKIVLDDQKVLNFCSNNYLGLATDSRVRKAAAEGIERDGVGAGASRLVCGHMQAHQLLEQKIAQVKDAEACLVFSTGYMANVGIISSLFGRDDIIFSDRLNHASIVDGITLSQAKFRRYPHCDIDALRRMLAAADGYRQRVIITDSVFSMDGDIAPLDKIVELAAEYNCMVMVDEAHAFGVIGEKGGGVVEHYGLQDEIDIQMGTLSKAVGVFGAYCCGSTELIDVLMNTARSFVYTTGLPPAIARAALASVEIIHNDSLLREKLWDNMRYMAGGLKTLGFDTFSSASPIFPILIGDAEKAVEFSNRLLKKGIFVSAIRPPTVPMNTARLRLTVMATHERDQMDYVLEELKKIRMSM